ncbi:unnamed protein product [Prunus armeniaca]|uniref:Uncharacterized protein n=1 Tax=Prunus armeniaca TaxID=36596 RepID=A0A6J5WUV6_PRUAR|nr:unnamed protein product [Prunus armeniaca]
MVEPNSAPIGENREKRPRVGSPLGEERALEMPATLATYSELTSNVHLLQRPGKEAVSGPFIIDRSLEFVVLKVKIVKVEDGEAFPPLE